MEKREDEGNRDSVERLMTMLSSPDHFDRAEAARQLCNMGKEAIMALPALLNLFKDPWYQVRIQVPRAIIRMQPRPEQVAEILSSLLDDEDETVRLYAREAQRSLFEGTS